MISSQECGNGGSEEGGEAVKPIQSLSAASAPSPLPPFESCTFFLAGINPFRRVIHPSIRERARVPLIDLIEERSFVRRSMKYARIESAAALFPNLVFRSAFPRTFAPQFNFDFAALRGGPFCTLIGSDVRGRAPRQMYAKVVHFHPSEFCSHPESGFSMANVLCVIWFRQSELLRGT